MSARLKLLLHFLMSSTCRPRHLHHQGARVAVVAGSHAVGRERNRSLLRAAIAAAALESSSSSSLSSSPSTTSLLPSFSSRPRSCPPVKTHTSAFGTLSLVHQRQSHFFKTSAASCSASTRDDASASTSTSTTSTSATHAEHDDTDAFLAPPSVTFESLGLDSKVCDALRASGIARPSAVQASAIPHLLSSSDAVLAAQTGSGKTIAYLAPLISRLRAAPALPIVADDDDDDENDDDDFSFDDDDDDENNKESPLPLLVVPSASDPPPPSLGILVLCPNAALCDQVVSVCNRIFNSEGLGLTAARVGGGGGGGGGGGFFDGQQQQHQALPSPPPDVTVATPAGLLAATYSSASNSEWSPEAVIRRTRAVVLDEADALLGGGYARDSRRVLEGMRSADEGVRLASARLWLSEERRKRKKNNRDLPSWRDLPQRARRAARDGGARALALELRRMAQPKPSSSNSSNSNSNSDSPSSSSSPASPFEIPSDLPRRQYVFAAATMPEDPRMTEAFDDGGDDDGGKASSSLRRKTATKKRSSGSSNSAPAGAVLRSEFPEAKWVGGFALHRPTPAVEHVWIELEEEEDERGEGRGDRREWARALVDAVTSFSPPTLSSSSSSSSTTTTATTTLVFARTAGAAAEAAERLRAAGVDALEYSSSVPLASRQRALEALRGEGGGGSGSGGDEKSKTRNVVVVATDAAARGLDLGSSSGGVDHVVQADFAANAVDWLHRVGRTGRGPGGGSKKSRSSSSSPHRSRVTSLVAGADAALAGAIRGALEAGLPVDGSFSRNRSFRNKMKKYGEFVPRGEVYKGGGGGGGSRERRDGRDGGGGRARG